MRGNTSILFLLTLSPIKVENTSYYKTCWMFDRPKLKNAYILKTNLQIKLILICLEYKLTVCYGYLLLPIENPTDINPTGNNSN